MGTKKIDAAHFSSDTLDFIRILDKHTVRYLIVGGEAVILYGYARLTGDVDFFFDQSSENVVRLHAALSEFWGGEAPGADRPEDLQSPNLVIQYGIPPNRIDLLGGIAGVRFEEAWTGRHTAAVVLGGVHDDLPVHFIGLVELLKNKRSAGRPKDLMDVEYLSGTARE